jgi:acylphosphatase
MERYRILFKGQVQSVGFRSYCKYIAISYNLTGYAINLPDFEYVEVELQGEPSEITKAVAKMNKGNMFIKVTDYQMKRISTKENEEIFEIGY